MTLHYKDIMQFVTKMGLFHIGFVTTKETPREAMAEAIRFLDSQGLPFGTERRIIIFLKFPPSTFLWELNDVAELLKEEMHKDAEILWTAEIQEELNEDGLTTALFIAGDFE